VKTLQTYTGLSQFDKGAVIALGNFDGLHRGHQAVIARAQAIADDLSAPLGIGLFRPHPFRFFKPDAEPFRLMSPRIRAQVMNELGVNFLYEIPFTEILRDLDDTDFVEQVLHQGLGIRHVVVGEDYGFGKNRCGTVESLTLVRPKFGVYVVEVRLEGEEDWRPGVANTGRRPTVDGEAARLEVHLLDFDRNLYGQLIDVRFRSFIRPEKKFESFDALKLQIVKDANGAKSILGCQK